MLKRLLLVPALLAATPAGAQMAPANDRLVAVAEWTSKFAATSADPAAAGAACGPQLSNTLGRVRDAASARAVAAQLKPCIDRIRSAYQRSAHSLAQFGPAPAEVRAAASFDPDRLVEDQRKQFAATLAYMDDVEVFLAALAANNRARADRLFPQVRAGGAALIDGSILQLRASQGMSRFAFTSSAIELRLVVAEASKLPMTGAVNQSGFAIGGSLKALAPRARAAVAAVRTSWEQDKASLRTLIGEDAGAERVIGPATRMVEDIALSGEQIAAALERAGGGSVVSNQALVSLMADISRHESAVTQSFLRFVQTLQTIGN